MITLLSIIVLTSIWNIGIEILLSEGMGLHKVRLWAESKSSKIFEPLITCIWCRPSIHSSIAFLAAAGLGWIELQQWNNLILYPFVVCGTSAVSGIVWSAYKYIEIKAKYYQHIEQQEYFNLRERKINYTKNKK